jgi:hypothetical protein
MSHSSKIFEEQPIRVQNLNGFDLSHMSSGTAYCGTLTPVLSRLTMQGMKFSLGCALQVELPPLATQAFGRIDAHVEVFWTPCSILYGGWKQFIANNPETSFILAQASYEQYDLPVWNFSDTTSGSPWYVVNSLDAQNYCLLDYLGIGAAVGQLSASTRNFKLLALLNYHKVWDVFYRNPQVTRTIFAVNPDTNGPGFSHNVAFVHHSYYSSLVANSSPVFTSTADLTFPDGVSVFSLRQRNYGNDYFTAGSLNPQQGNPASVAFTVDLNTGDGEFSISSLRLSNSLQRFYELANYSPEYRSIMRANFGFTPGDAGYDEPVYLGRLVVPVYQKGIYLQDVANAAGDSSGNSNPFINGTFSGGGLGSVGAKAASASFNGSGEIVTNFKCKSWGYLLGLFSLVPHAQYSYGIDRDFLRLGVGEHPFPVLQSVGMDAVKEYEIYATSSNISSDTDFSYLPRYSYDKYVNDTVHGELRPGKNLQSFIIQRAFSAAPAFNTAFLEIGISDLDSILAIDSTVLSFTCWYECFWVFKAVMPLAEFCVPTLGDVTEDTHKINVKQGGSRL